MNPSGNICPLCAASKVRSFDAQAFDSPNRSQRVAIRICDACDFAWQWPLNRTVEESKSYFEAEYAEQQQGSYFDKDSRTKIAHLQLEFLAELKIKEQSLLDIGCGDGVFVSLAAAEGWHAFGLDPSMPLSTISLATGNLEVLKGGLDELDSEKLFHCVTLWDVVEHLPQPEIVLKKAWDRVLPGGWLVIETGNFQSVEQVIAGPKWWAWQLDHRWYFSPSTLMSFIKSFEYVEICIADRVLRPLTNGGEKYKPPSKLQTLLSVLKRPWKKSQIIAEHQAKRQAALKWPEWSGLQIFALAVRK